MSESLIGARGIVAQILEQGVELQNGGIQIVHRRLHGPPVLRDDGADLGKSAREAGTILIADEVIDAIHGHLQGCGAVVEVLQQLL